MQVPVIGNDRIRRITAIGIFIFMTRKFSTGTRAVIMKAINFPRRPLSFPSPFGNLEEVELSRIRFEFRQAAFTKITFAKKIGGLFRVGINHTHTSGPALRFIINNGMNNRKRIDGEVTGFLRPGQRR